MGLKKTVRKFFHLHEDPPQRAPSSILATADHLAESSPITTNSTHLQTIIVPPHDGGSVIRSASRQSQNTTRISQRTASSDRRAEEDKYLSPPASAVISKRPSLDNHNTPVRQPSGLVKTGSQLVSDKVDCEVILVYNGKSHRADELDRIWWLDKSQYAHFDYAADRWLHDWGVPDSKQLYRKSGRCRLINHEGNREFDSKILETEEQWSEVLPYLITSFVSKHPYVKFHLEILWEYSDLSINKIENEPYADTVRKVIHEKLKLNWENQKFIPRKDLFEILSDSTVKELINSDKSLNKVHDLDRDKFIQEVALDASRLLAICVYVNLPLACLYELTQQGLSDVDLPLTEPHCPQDRYEVSFSTFVLWQGAFIAHDFEDDEGRPKHRKIVDEVVLPIICNKKEDLLGEGGFGMVYKVRIDADHHLFSVNREIPFALKVFKELGSQTEADFHSELKVLTTLSETSHPHITGHLASWTHRSKFYMLFQCADTNLGKFLRLQPHPELTNCNVRWLLLQLKGLAEGVRHIHILGPAGLGPDGLTADDRPPQKKGRSGYHHDLKPQNILVFICDNLDGREPAISEMRLKISDFGAARINVILSQSGLDKSNFSPEHTALVRGDPVYSAPDYTLEHKTSRPYDIWSLGCVFLEVLLWAHGLSNSDLSVFDFDRLKSHNSRSTKFWHQDERGKVILKSAVVDRLRQLQNYCQDRGVFKHLVRLTARMLTITPKDRPKASEICNDLEAMLIQAERDFKEPGFYQHAVLLHDEIAAPLTNEGTSRRPSIDERSIRAFENGLLQVRSNDQRRPRSSSFRQQNDLHQFDDQNGDIGQDGYRLSSITTQGILPGPSHSRSPSIAVSEYDAPFPSVPIEQTNGSNGYVPQPLLGSHSSPVGREDLNRPARPRARSTDSRRSQSSP